MEIKYDNKTYSAQTARELLVEPYMHMLGISENRAKHHSKIRKGVVIIPHLQNSEDIESYVNALDALGIKVELSKRRYELSDIAGEVNDRKYRRHSKKLLGNMLIYDSKKLKKMGAFDGPY